LRFYKIQAYILTPWPGLLTIILYDSATACALDDSLKILIVSNSS